METYLLGYSEKQLQREFRGALISDTLEHALENRGRCIKAGATPPVKIFRMVFVEVQISGEMPALTLERLAKLRKRARPRMAEKQRSIHCDDLAVLCDLAESALRQPRLTREQFVAIHRIMQRFCVITHTGLKEQLALEGLEVKSDGGGDAFAAGMDITR